MSHPLISSGVNAAVTIFDEEEIVAGDIVKVELDLEVFKMMQEAAGLTSDVIITKVSLSLAHDCVHVSVLTVSIAAVELPPLASEEHECNTDLTTCRRSCISWYSLAQRLHRPCAGSCSHSCLATLRLEP